MNIIIKIIIGVVIFLIIVLAFIDFSSTDKSNPEKQESYSAKEVPKFEILIAVIFLLTVAWYVQRGVKKREKRGK